MGYPEVWSIAVKDGNCRELRCVCVCVCVCVELYVYESVYPEIRYTLSDPPGIGGHGRRHLCLLFHDEESIQGLVNL